MRKVGLSMLFVILLLTIFTAVSIAADYSSVASSGDSSALLQADVRGSIRGTIYADTNGDGVCVGTGEPTRSGVTVQFVSTDGQTTLYLQSGADGSYGLVAVGLGTWTVSAIPPSGYSVTSTNPLQVHLSAEQRDITGADFCVAQGTGTGGGTPVLPESGAAIAPPIVVAMISGLGLITAGAAVEFRRRRSK